MMSVKMLNIVDYRYLYALSTFHMYQLLLALFLHYTGSRGLYFKMVGYRFFFKADC